MNNPRPIKIDTELVKNTVYFMIDVLSTDEASLIFTQEELTIHTTTVEALFHHLINNDL